MNQISTKFTRIFYFILTKYYRRNNCHLPHRFCHLLLLTLFVISYSYSASAPKSAPTNKTIFEVEFLNKILNQIVPGKPILDNPASPLGPLITFRKFSDIHEIKFVSWQYQTYRYPLFIQVYNQQISDFYLTFPSFMLHDSIFEALIQKWGKQQYYQRNNFSAIYHWKNINAGLFAAIYEANCSITCFPVSLSLQSLSMPKEVLPLWQQFHTQGIDLKKQKKK